MDHYVDLTQIVANVVAVLGVPAALFAYAQGKRREQRDRDLGTHSVLDDRFDAHMSELVAPVDADPPPPGG